MQIMNHKSEWEKEKEKASSSSTTTDADGFKNFLDGRVIHLCLVLLRVLHLPDRFHKVVLDGVVPLFSNGEHAGFGTDVSEIGSVEAVGQLKRGRPDQISVLLADSRIRRRRKERKKDERKRTFTIAS
jgi:hypothetical protein